MCHDVRNPKGSSPVKLLILNNSVYIDELRVVIKSIYGSTYQTERVKGSCQAMQCTYQELCGRIGCFILFHWVYLLVDVY